MAKPKKETNFEPRPYMQLAIEEMNKSKNEPRPDGKVPPKVGAILLFPDGRVERAHRGELREGDHAEYTLLERKLGHERLDDCILFTTLEPCVERNHPKLPCCKRTSNARIKTVYVGIGDPDPTVDGKGIEHLQTKKIMVVMFDRDLQKIIEDENILFREQALERKRMAEEEVEEIVTALELPVSTSAYDEFSAEALQKFIIGAGLNYKIEDPSFQKYLISLGVLTFDKSANSYKPTGTGVLLFGHNPRLFFKQAVLKAHVDYGGGKVEQVNFDQPLVLVPDLIQAWLLKVLPLSKDTSSFKRKEVSDFPMDVLREVIINAIVHRDYNIKGAKSSLEIDNEKIVIKSPGAPLPSISLEQLNTFKAPSISRNPIITYVFNLMGYVEETGFGMRAIKSMNEEYGLPLPEYTFEDPFLILTFPRNMAAVKKVTHIDAVTELNNEELAGYEFIKSKEKITRKEYQDHFQFESDKKAERHLKKMVELKLLRRLGAGPSVHYEIIPTQTPT